MIEKCCKDFINLMDVYAKPENIHHKFVVMDEVSKLYDKLIKEYKTLYEIESKDDKRDGQKQKYDPKNLKPLDYKPVKSNTESLSDKSKSDLKELKQLNETHKLLWIKLSKKDFNSLIKDVDDSLDDDNYKTTVNGNKYDLNNV